MTRSVAFYFDFGSPTAYLAFTQLPRIAEQAGADLVFKPVLLGGIFEATKNRSPVTVPAKGAYMIRDLERFAKRYAVPLRFGPYFPINTLSLMRIAIGTQSRHPKDFATLVSAFFRATWVDGLNMGDPATVSAVVAGCGLDATNVLALAQDEEIKELLKRETAAAVSRGLFGVPSMVVGDELFWGQDRLDFVTEALS